jgi:hypothetical protein
MTPDALILVERAFAPVGLAFVLIGGFLGMTGHGWIARLCGLAMAQAGVVVLLAGAGAGAAATGFAVLSAVGIGLGVLLLLRLKAAGGKIAVEPTPDETGGAPPP